MNNIGIEIFGVFKKNLKRIVNDHIVAVDEGDILADCESNPHVARKCGSSGVFGQLDKSDLLTPLVCVCVV